VHSAIADLIVHAILISSTSRRLFSTSHSLPTDSARPRRLVLVVRSDAASSSPVFSGEGAHVVGELILWHVDHGTTDPVCVGNGPSHEFDVDILAVEVSCQLHEADM
jgi:hypothetical protein